MTGTCFKVDARMQPGYWLARDCVASSTGNDVRPILDQDRLDAAKAEGPEHTGVHRHDGSETVP